MATFPCGNWSTMAIGSIAYGMQAGILLHTGKLQKSGRLHWFHSPILPGGISL